MDGEAYREKLQNLSYLQFQNCHGCMAAAKQIIETDFKVVLATIEIFSTSINPVKTDNLSLF